MKVFEIEGTISNREWWLDFNQHRYGLYATGTVQIQFKKLLNILYCDPSIVFEDNTKIKVTIEVCDE